MIIRCYMCSLSEVFVVEGVEGGAKVLSHPVHNRTQSHEHEHTHTFFVSYPYLYALFKVVENFANNGFYFTLQPALRGFRHASFCECVLFYCTCFVLLFIYFCLYYVCVTAFIHGGFVRALVA